MIDARAIRRLQAMEVPVWQLRVRESPPPESNAPESNAPESEAPEGQASPRRIRLEAGSGRWLLVVDDAERDRHAALLEDIRATLGADDCRFGTWSDSPDAGIAVSERQAHDIAHVLVFDGDGDGAAGDGLVHAALLDRLSTSAQARRALWHGLRPLQET